jgi:hypothetical protein
MTGKSTRKGAFFMPRPNVRWRRHRFARSFVIVIFRVTVQR